MSRDNLLMGGAFCRTARLHGHTTAVAGGSGDATQANGLCVSRKSAKGMAQSAKLVINWTTTLAAGKKLTFAVQFQDAIDAAAAGAANFADAVAATTVALDSGAGSTLVGTTEIDIDLTAAREFIRAQITPDLDASGTDTANFNAVIVFFGDHREPTTAAIATLGTADAI